MKKDYNKGKYRSVNCKKISCIYRDYYYCGECKNYFEERELMRVKDEENSVERCYRFGLICMSCDNKCGHTITEINKGVIEDEKSCHRIAI